MAVGSVLIALQGSFGDGRGVTPADFLHPLQIVDADGIGAAIATGGAWEAGRVYFPLTKLSVFQRFEEPHKAFFLHVHKVLLSVARFLNRRKGSAFASMRKQGLRVRLFIDVRMNQDQMELELPPELVSACGRKKLGIFVISNDIAADEVR